MRKHLKCVYWHRKIYKIYYSVEKARCKTVDMGYYHLNTKGKIHMYFCVCTGYLWKATGDAGHGQF